MDTILLEGHTYTKASILAKRFHYTSDYIGQLCRSNKVVCHMVGRTWYVTEDSLLAHKDARYKELRIDENSYKNNVISDREEHVLVKTRRVPTVIAEVKNNPKPNFVDRLDWVQSRYVPDDSDLLPQPIKKRKILPKIPAKLPIDVAEAKEVKVVSGSRSVSKLEFTPLPEVPLSGSIEVQDVVMPESFDLGAPVVSPQPTVNVVTKKRLPERSALTKQSHDPLLQSKIPATHAQPPRVHASIRFTPDTVAVVAPSESTKFLFAISAVVAVVFVLFLATTSYSYTVESGNLSAAVQLSWENLRQFLSEIRTQL